MEIREEDTMLENEGEVVEDDNDNDMETEENEEPVLKPQFPELKPNEMSSGQSEVRKVPVPPHRYTPLRENWMKIYKPVVEQMKLQIRMNTTTRKVELKTSPYTEDISALQKGADFVQAFLLGFEVDDALAILRLDDLYVETFQIEDVKNLKGDHLSRAIGRIAGKDGQTKFTIENATRTRIVLADRKIHILGSHTHVKVARDAICDLILGSPPGKVYSKLRTISSRMNERF